MQKFVVLKRQGEKDIVDGCDGRSITKKFNNSSLVLVLNVLLLTYCTTTAISWSPTLISHLFTLAFEVVHFIHSLAFFMAWQFCIDPIRSATIQYIYGSLIYPYVALSIINLYVVD